MEEPTPQEQQIIDYFKEVFLKRVEDDTREFKAVYWHKWIGTYAVAAHFGVPCSNMRKVLKQMEKKGIVHSSKASNVWLIWALNKIEGYKQHQFKDYFTKAESPVDIMR